MKLAAEDDAVGLSSKVGLVVMSFCILHVYHKEDKKLITVKPV